MFKTTLPLARCDNRRQLARLNPVIGDPTSWLTPGVLGPRELRVTSFDYFIDWSSDQLSREVWVKLCPDHTFGEWDSSTPDEIGQEAMKFGPMESAVAFGHANELVVKGMSFRDDAPWSPQPSRIVAIDATAAVNGESTLDIVRQDIRRLSGGAVTIGRKGL